MHETEWRGRSTGREHGLMKGGELVSGARVAHGRVVQDM
jgi:hypothetical protein